MLKVLIFTRRTDEDARCVAEALHQKGVVAIRWFTDEYLLHQKSSLHLECSGCSSFKITGVDEIEAIDIREFDVVWFRGPGHPSVPPYAHPEDLKWINIENKMYLRALWLSLEHSAVWVNPLSSELKSTNKVWQLQEAARLGLLIPETLVSSDREAIAAFIAKNDTKQGTIYKTLSHTTLPYTCTISTERLPSQKTLGLTPGIYQAVQPKAFEVRATFFEEHCIAVRLDNASEQDWKLPEVLQKLAINPHTLPHCVYQQCVELMQALGIVFGCFDFIVTPAEEYVFLEISETGQFLWIEERLPKLKLLDTFCNFLIRSARRKEEIDPQLTPVSLQDILAAPSYQQLKEKDQAVHLQEAENLSPAESL